MKEFARADRVAEQLRIEIGQALVREVRDPRLENVTVMAVVIDDGLEHARVFWLPFGTDSLSDRDRARIERALAKATPFLRHHVGKKLALRIVPQLVFEYDISQERGRIMDEMIEKVRREDAENYPDLVKAPLDDTSDESDG